MSNPPPLLARRSNPAGFIKPSIERTMIAREGRGRADLVGTTHGSTARKGVP